MARVGALIAEHAGWRPTDRIGPSREGGYKGGPYTGTTQGAQNTILVDLFAQCAASAGLLSSSAAHAASRVWNHHPQLNTALSPNTRFCSKQKVVFRSPEKSAKRCVIGRH